MPINPAAPATSSPALTAYRDQVSKLEQDPNATSSYKDGLEKQFAAVSQQLSSQDGSPPASSGWGAPAAGAPAVPAQPAPTAPAPPAASPDLASPGALPPSLQALMPQIKQASQVTGESANLIAAQVWQESRGVSGASTTNGGTGQADAGLMQVDAATFKQLQQQHPELQGKSLGDKLVNIEAGSFYEQDLKRQFGSDDLALRAYNSGPGSVNKGDANVTATGLGDPTYVRKVDAFADDIQAGTALPA